MRARASRQPQDLLLNAYQPASLVGSTVHPQLICLRASATADVTERLISGQEGEQGLAIFGQPAPRSGETVEAIAICETRSSAR